MRQCRRFGVTWLISSRLKTTSSTSSTSRTNSGQRGGPCSKHWRGDCSRTHSRTGSTTTAEAPCTRQVQQVKGARGACCRSSVSCARATSSVRSNIVRLLAWSRATCRTTTAGSAARAPSSCTHTPTDVSTATHSNQHHHHDQHHHNHHHQQHRNKHHHHLKQQPAIALTPS